jgi:hypothetical protein
MRTIGGPTFPLCIGHRRASTSPRFNGASTDDATVPVPLLDTDTITTKIYILLIAFRIRFNFASGPLVTRGSALDWSFRPDVVIHSSIQFFRTVSNVPLYFSDSSLWVINISLSLSLSRAGMRAV